MKLFLTRYERFGTRQVVSGPQQFLEIATIRDKLRQVQNHSLHPATRRDLELDISFVWTKS